MDTQPDTGDTLQVRVYKILVLGNSGTGKTSLVRRSVRSYYSQDYRATIGVDFSLKVINWSQCLELRLEMWDLAGQDRFSHLSRLYYGKAAGALLVCDQQDKKSVEGLVRWKHELDTKTNGTLPSVILANKSDLRPVVETVRGEQDLEMEELVQEVGAAAWTRTSALTGEGVEEGVRTLVWHILEREACTLVRDQLNRSDSIIQLPTVDQSPASKSSCQC